MTQSIIMAPCGAEYMVELLRTEDGEYTYRGYRRDRWGGYGLIKCRTRAQEDAFPKALALAGSLMCLVARKFAEGDTNGVPIRMEGCQQRSLINAT